MQSVVEVVSREVAVRSAARPRRRSTTRSFFEVLRRFARLDFFSLEDEIGRAVDRAFDEFAREMRK